MDYYLEIQNDLKQKYNKHYNLYQKQQLEQKILCYKNNQDDPVKYYSCINNINERMNINSTTLMTRFNQIEIDIKDCHSKCIDDQKCDIKCKDEAKKQANQLQEQFYKLMLQSNLEFKKIQ